MILKNIFKVFSIDSANLLHKVYFKQYISLRRALVNFDAPVPILVSFVIQVSLLNVTSLTVIVLEELLREHHATR